MVAYTFNSMDRSIISIIAPSMKADLKLTDTQLGLLGGTAFAVLYAFGGIAIARLAERASRVDIIAAALIVWSGLTALCGAAANVRAALRDASRCRGGGSRVHAACAFPDLRLFRALAAHLRAVDLFLRHFPRLHPRGAWSAVMSRSISVGAGPVRWWAFRASRPRLLIKGIVREPPRDPASAAPLTLRHELRELRIGRPDTAVRSADSAHGAGRGDRCVRGLWLLRVHAVVLHPRLPLGVRDGRGHRRHFRWGDGRSRHSRGRIHGGCDSRAAVRAGMRWCRRSAV